MLVAAAYLHDIGAAPGLGRLGMHAIDGASRLRELGQERLAGLVAYHSGTRYEAELRGLSAALAGFDDERSDVSQALWFCDLTTSPAGDSVSLGERIADVERRHGRDSVVVRAMVNARDEFELCIEQVEARLRAASGTLSR